MSLLFNKKRASRFERRRKKKKKQKRSPRVRLLLRVLLIILVLGVVSLILTGIYKGTRHPSVVIDRIEVQGGETIAPEEVRNRARELLRGTYFFLIPRDFAYLYPEEEIHAAIARMPRVSEVTVERDSRQSIHISFEEYVPNALWCTSRSASTTEPCIFLDENGYAFAEAPKLDGSVLVRFVTEAQETQVGAHMLSIGQLFATREFIAALERRHDMYIEAVTHTTEGDIIYHIRGGGDIITSSDAEIQDAFDTLESVLESKEFDHLAPGAFLYIDLRFGNKVYIKEEETASSSTTTPRQDTEDNE